MLTAFDVGVGILVLISALLATARGLTREVLSLATWAGSALFAVWMYFEHPDIARNYIREEIVADVATVILSFIVALIVLHLLTMRIADFVVDSRIGPLDRTLGFVFGALRGILIAVIIVIFGNWLNWFSFGEYVVESRSLPMLADLGDSLISLLPEELESQVSDFLSSGALSGDGVIETAPETSDVGENDTPINA